MLQTRRYSHLEDKKVKKLNPAKIKSCSTSPKKLTHQWQRPADQEKTEMQRLPDRALPKNNKQISSKDPADPEKNEIQRLPDAALPERTSRSVARSTSRQIFTASLIIV